MKRRVNKFFMVVASLLLLITMIGCSNPFYEGNSSKKSALENSNVISEAIIPSAINLTEMPDVLISVPMPRPLVNVSAYKSSGYVYSTRSDDRRKAYDKVLSALYAHSKDDYSTVDFAPDDLSLICAVDLSDCNITPDEAVYSVWDVFSDHMEFFYIEEVYTYADDTHRIIYIMTKDDYADFKDRDDVYTTMDEHVNNVLMLTADAKSDADKARIVAEYVKDRITYAEDSSGNAIVNMDTLNVSGALRDGWAVCGGYAKAYSFLAEQVGLDTIYVTGYASGGYHAWNYVDIDGKWYFVDTTWSDGEGYTQWVLLGDKTLNTHVPDYMDGSNEYSYSLPSLSKDDYVIKETIDDANSSEANDDYSDNDEIIDADNNPLDADEVNPPIQDTVTDEAPSPTPTPDIITPNPDITDTGTVDKSWSEWLDILPHYVSVNPKEYIVEEAAFYRYQYEDTRHTDHKSAKLEREGYSLIETNNDISSWSDYSTTKPSNSNGIEIESKVQIRKITREYTESSESSLNGWTLYDAYKTDGGWSNWSQTYPIGQNDIESREIDDIIIQLPRHTTSTLGMLLRAQTTSTIQARQQRQSATGVDLLRIKLQDG